ncbi:MAG: cupin domain-containing protein [Rhodanobacter sp.]|nr:cupin domain-containing protein [Rhodanobacter sp.]
MKHEIRATPSQWLGMSPARFLRDYWQKHPLLIRAAFPQFSGPVTPDDLAGLACEDSALARIAIRDPRSDHWEVRTGPFAAGDFARLPSTHWTLLVQDVDKWDAQVGALLAAFAFLPRWRFDDVMLSYAVDGGSVGAHIDHYDVFLLQGLGRKRWQISTDPAAPTAFRDDVELRLLREFAPTHDWTLEPGDVLYLPPGVPHHGVAVGECLTYSFGLRAPSAAELLLDFSEAFAEHLPESQRMTDPDLAPARGDGEIHDTAIARVMAALPWLRIAPATRAAQRDEIDPAFLRAWFGRFITRYRSAQIVAANPQPLTDRAFERAVTQATRVRRNPWSRCAWIREGNHAVLFVCGESHVCSPALARTLGAYDEFSLADIAPRDRTLVRMLIDAGHFALLRARSRKSS